MKIGGIHAYTGLLGSGKTYTMLWDAVFEFRRQPFQVYTNMRELRCPEAIYFHDLAEILNIESGLILYDETAVALNARMWSEVPKEFVTHINQIRKNGLSFWFTSQTEDRTDRTLRELVAEFVRCRKFFGSVMARSFGPDGKEPIAMPRFVPLRPNIFSLYNTNERVERDGRSMGMAANSAPLSRVARRRASVEHQARQDAKESSRIPMMVTNGVWSSYTEEAWEARTWLQERGMICGSEPIARQVQRELHRRRWLAIWGLTIEDVPDTCTYENPWLIDFTPDEVEERGDIRQMRLAADDLMTAANRRARRGLSRAV